MDISHIQHTDSLGRRLLFCFVCLRVCRSAPKQAITINMGKALCEEHIDDYDDLV